MEISNKQAKIFITGMGSTSCWWINIATLQNFHSISFGDAIHNTICDILQCCTNPTTLWTNLQYSLVLLWQSLFFQTYSNRYSIAHPEEKKSFLLVPSMSYIQPLKLQCCAQYSIIHYNGVIMSAVVSQITSLTIVYSTVYSDADQRKHQSSASLAFVRRIHQWPVKS